MWAVAKWRKTTTDETEQAIAKSYCTWLKAHGTTEPWQLGQLNAPGTVNRLHSRPFMGPNANLRPGLSKQVKVRLLKTVVEECLPGTLTCTCGRLENRVNSFFQPVPQIRRHESAFPNGDACEPFSDRLGFFVRALASCRMAFLCP